MRYAAVLLVIVTVACAKGEREPRAAGRDSLTQRQRDSVLGASRLPGAAGIRGALRAQDSAAAQNARLDSVR
jgi:hypothetical protein